TVFWGRDNVDQPLTDTIYVYDDNTGQPGTLLDKQAVSVGTGGTRIIEYAFNGPAVTGDFWILMYGATKSTGPSRYYMVADNANSGNSYTSTSPTGTWSAYTGGDIVIRAGIAYYSTATDSGTLYIINNDPLSVKPVNVTGISVKNGSSWLSVSPKTGSIGPNDSLAVNVYIDTTGLLKQEYRDTLLVQTDADFAKAVTLEIPVIITGNYMTDIETVNLSVTADGNDALLTWRCDESSNYAVSRSRSKDTRNIIANISGAPGINKYRDISPDGKIVYYSVGKVDGSEILWSSPVMMSMMPQMDKLSVNHTIGSAIPFIYYQTDSPKETEVTMHDITGRKVMTLYNGILNGRDKNTISKEIPAGIYFIRMQTPDRTYSKRITVVR
ncbi:MAG: T9SS type A sorting domain-containing protein, partial [candidate division WOR-3 bacterium]|nr:T9SS type A sorting domain-containing protein [candidate division WOR-3 bacterium]